MRQRSKALDNLLECRYSDGLQRDHINRDQHDHRRENVRMVTVTANHLNHGIHNIVYRFRCWRRPYEAVLQGRTLGNFATLQESRVAYNEAHINLFVTELSKTRHLNLHLLDGEYYHYQP